MCDECRAFTAQSTNPVANGAPGRELIARRITIDDGVCPDMLVVNTLDEEPLDGLLPTGEPGHFSWRNRLLRADKLYPTAAYA
jgi:hypothetical protein